jgi:glucokinase
MKEERREGKFIVSVDLGGTQIRAALCEKDGKIISRTSTLTLAEEGKDAVIERIKESIQSVLPHDKSTVEAIGIVAPGPLDPWEGVIIEAPNLPGWKNVNLKEIIGEEFDLPVYVGNDANLAALAEYRFGAGKGASNLIYLTISTGIGGGIIIDHKLFLGAYGLAAEVGHMTLEADGPRCKCGNVGCLEALASGTAIAKRAVESILAGEKTMIIDLVGGDLEKITAKEVSEAAKADDPLAVRIFTRAGYYIGVGIVNLLHLFNPNYIVIGGSVAKAGSVLFYPIRVTMMERTMSDRYWVPIKPAALGDDVGILGGVALVLSQ